MILTTYDKGKAEGKTEGKREALQDILLELAAATCGAPDESVRQQVQRIDDVARLRRLCKAAPTAQSWEELLASQ